MRIDTREDAENAHAAALENKARIRASALAARDALAAAYRGEASRRIADAIVATPAFREAVVVMAYSSFGTELDTQSIIAAANAAGKALVMPRVNRAQNRLDMYCVRDPDVDLVAGVWGILEPDPARCAPTDGTSIDFVLVPGVAFDRHGGRIGYGKGYYDRLLGERIARARPLRMVAGAFDAQIVDRIPIEPHDVVIDSIVTESQCFACSR